ncbi:CHASE2 domain-containing protein [Almyronema epifaneia]|uniref:CHASE2 domain-containing protein n=1 Tax=Almyronema epifaneia S1 TaxID=2991925 RepID=A0ABW6IJD0_9CYAN
MALPPPFKQLRAGLPRLAWTKLAPFLQTACLTSLLLSAAVIGGRSLGLLQGLELAAYDQLIRIRPDRGPDPRLLIVGITENDIQTRREWPIQDQTIADLLAKLLADEPEVIGLDIFRDVPIGSGHVALLRQLHASDRIIPVCKLSSAEDPGIAPPADVAPTAVGFSDIVVDPGGILRRNLLVATPEPFEDVLPLQHRCNGSDVILSFGLQLALRYLAARGIEPQLTETETIQLDSVRLNRFRQGMGGYQQVDDNGYQLLLNYRSAKQVAPQVTLGQVLAGQVKPELIRDRIVLIGLTTPQAKDEFYTPYSGGLQDQQKMPGVLVHAQSVSQILSAVLDGRPLIWAWSNRQEAAWIVGWGLVGGVFAWFIRHPLWFGSGLFLLNGILYGLVFWLFLQGGWIPLIPPALAVLISASGVVLVDRFHHSSYGQAVYRQVKNFLRLNIEIDTVKVERQVSEIAETEYFSQLQQRAKQLRKQRQSPSAKTSAAEPKPAEKRQNPSSEISSDIEE